MRQPKDLNEAKAMIREEKNKLLRAFNAVIGSRPLMALLATFVIAFALHAVYAPTRLPTVGAVSLVQVGLPPLDLGVVGEQLPEVKQAAANEDLPGRWREFVAENSANIPLWNWIGFGVAFVLLAINLTIMTIRRRYTRG